MKLEEKASLTWIPKMPVGRSRTVEGEKEIKFEDSARRSKLGMPYTQPIIYLFSA
jgi:hypothetical protein